MYQLFLGAACLGFAPIFVKLVSLGPTPIGIYRCGIAAVLLFFVSGAERAKPKSGAWSPELWFYLILSGLLFALDLFVWHRSVIYAGAGLGTILGNTQVFYVSAAGILFYREKLTLRFVLSVVLAFVGTFLLVSYRLAPAGAADRYWEGVFFGLSTGIVYSCYVLAIRQAEKLSSGISPALRLALVSGTTALALIPISAIEGSLRLPTAAEWIWLLSLALIAQVIGWLLISKNLMRVPVSRAGLILITQPLVSAFAGAALFGERFGSIQIVGAVIIFAALYLGTSRK